MVVSNCYMHHQYCIFGVKLSTITWVLFQALANINYKEFITQPQCNITTMRLKKLLYAIALLIPFPCLLLKIKKETPELATTPVLEYSYQEY